MKKKKHLNPHRRHLRRANPSFDFISPGGGSPGRSELTKPSSSSIRLFSFASGYDEQSAAAVSETWSPGGSWNPYMPRRRRRRWGRAWATATGMGGWGDGDIGEDVGVGVGNGARAMATGAGMEGGSEMWRMGGLG